MSRLGPMLHGIAALAALLAVASCSPVFTYHGFVPTDEDLQEIEVGLDTRTTVASIIGKPGASGLLAESGWYYVRSEFEHAPVRGPQEIDREVVAISFDENNVVANVERFGLERGEVVVLSRRVTDSNIAGVSFLGQLFGSTAAAANISQIFSNQ
ncbi:MAG: outer membrane protein assembly factor BamE [Maritimibacter sp.]|nr:outer membrane protein assembly factor BamE [Maritimibacter sp.]